MRKTLLTIAATIAISTSAHASGSAMGPVEVMQWEDWATKASTSTMENCLNAQGKFWAFSRKGYCADKVPMMQAYHKQNDVRVEQNKVYVETSAALIVEHNQLMAQKLKQAKAQGMTCALREDGEGVAFIMCKDEVGTFKLK